LRLGRNTSIVLFAVCAVSAAGLGAGIVDRRQIPVPGEIPAPAAPAVPVPVADLHFDAAIDRAATLPRLRSLLISVDGRLAAERYFYGATALGSANIKSASKSLIATLVGIALDRGQLRDVHEPIGRFIPEYVKNDPQKGAITLEDLLTMRAGLETTSNRNYGRWVSSPNWVRFVLQQPFVDEPGGRMIYSTGNSHLLSAILTRTTGASTLAFAQSALAKPLGVAIGSWARDPQGIYLGGNEMAMRPRDMLRFGELYLNEGRYNGRQVLSAHWIRESTLPRTTSRWSGREYGYGWWIRSLAGIPVFYAWGYGGQFIFVVPPLRTVVVTTSVSEPGSERREHLDAIYSLVEEHVMTVAATAFPGVVIDPPTSASPEPGSQVP
jgi:CubicO group peptidase (beta-lactamase class C family)